MPLSVVTRLAAAAGTSGAFAISASETSSAGKSALATACVTDAWSTLLVAITSYFQGPNNLCHI